METIDLSLKMKLQELEQSILTAHPRIPLLLKDIHTQLKNDPAVVTLLSEDEIAIIVSGLKHQTKTEITQAALKKKVTGKSLTVNDL